MISGFLAYDGFDENLDIKSYYIRRLTKIVPRYYFILLVCVVTDFFIPLGTENIDFGSWLRYFTFTNMLIPSKSFGDFNDLFGFWTMGCFPIFYLMVPFLYKLMSSLRRVIWLIIAALGVSVLSRTLTYVLFGKLGFNGAGAFGNLNPLGTLYLFVFGMASAYAYRKSEEKTVAVAFGAVFLLMLMLEKAGYVLWGLAVSIICLMPNCGRQSNCSSSWNAIIRFLDKNSFNIYLLHLLVYKVETTISGSNGIYDCVICIIVTIMLADFLERLVKFSTRLLNERVFQIIHKEKNM